MKFNIQDVYNKSKDNKELNTLTKCLYAFSGIVLLISLLTFIPVTSLYFVINYIGIVCRYLSIIVVVFLIIYFIKLIKLQLSISNNIYLKSSIIIFSISVLLYIVCFILNVLSLFI